MFVRHVAHDLGLARGFFFGRKFFFFDFTYDLLAFFAFAQRIEFIEKPTLDLISFLIQEDKQNDHCDAYNRPR